MRRANLPIEANFPANRGRMRHFGLEQRGAQVEVIEREGENVLRPHVAVPVDQTWFWAERWQQMEREADDAVVAGRVTATDGLNEFLDELDS